MGAWGTAITSDDTVMDVADCMVASLKKGGNLTTATQTALLEYRDLLEDPDDGPLVWLAVAHVQWKYGLVENRILSKVCEDVEKGAGLELWAENPKNLKKRIEVLLKFVSKISHPNPKPSAYPKTVVRPAPFKAGDCLSVVIAEKQFGAVIVLAVDNRNVEYGLNLVGSLDYLSEHPPGKEVFEERKWLYLHHGKWNGRHDLFWVLPVGFAKLKERFSVVCQTDLRSFDPRESDYHSSWSGVGRQIVIQRAADAT
jgi:hypothetical protein